MASLEQLHRMLSDAVDRQIFPGAVWAVGDASRTLALGSVGVADPARPERLMTPETLFDLASLTKIIATWACVGTLWEAGRLTLDQPLADLLPITRGHQLAQVTVRQLLTHTSGVPPRAQLRPLYGDDPAAVRLGIAREPLHRPAGEAVQYTDRSAQLLAYVVEELSGQSLEACCQQWIWQPLSMRHTRYGPLPEALAARCAPTEFDPETGQHLCGRVHDFSARILGASCGISGIFAPARDLGLFLRHLLHPTEGAGFGAAWTGESLQVQTGRLRPERGLFWHPAPGSLHEADTWMHTGFTGTTFWVSPAQDRWGVLLTNKLYYTRERPPINHIRNAFRQVVFG